MVIYWITLPLMLLGVVLGSVGLILGPTTPATPDLQLPFTLGCAAFAAVLAWRLWLNSRALGWAGPAPGPGRLLLAWAPLVLLALVGLVVLAWGLIWLIIAGWLLLAPENSTTAFQQLVMGLGVALGGGVLMALVGAALMFPLARLIKARPRPQAEP